MTDPQKGIDEDIESEDSPAAAPDAEDAAVAPVDLGATVTLSPEALAALLEEVKKGRKTG
jgi:hypothetical protein